MNRDEFLEAAIPYFRQLKAYIKRRLRVAYLTFEIHEGPYTSDDVLEELIVRAYDRYDEKPTELSLREWLYVLTNDTLEADFHEREREERRWLRHHDKRMKPRAALRERIAAEVGGEPWLLEPIDDSDYHPDDFAPPQYVHRDEPSEDTDKKDVDGKDADNRKDEVVRISQALSRVPLKERLTFEFFDLEGFDKEETSRLLSVSAREVPREAQWVRERVFQELYQKLYAGQGAER